MSPHSNAAGALEVVKLATMQKLCAWEDGCWCTGCQVHGVDIDITCHKSTGSDVQEFFPGHWGPVLAITEARNNSPESEVRALAEAVCAELLGGDDWCYYSQIAVRVFGHDEENKEGERRALQFVARRMEDDDATRVVFLPPDQAALPTAEA